MPSVCLLQEDVRLRYCRLRPAGCTIHTYSSSTLAIGKITVGTTHGGNNIPIPRNIAQDVSDEIYFRKIGVV